MQNSISEIIIKEELVIQNRIERLSLLSGSILFLTAFWCLLPIFTNNTDPLKVLTPAVVALLWAGILPDFSISSPATRSRIGAITSIFCIPLAVLGTNSILDSGFKLVGGIILIICSIALFLLSRNILFGEFKVIRYRSIMYMIGVFAGLSVLIPQGFETNNFGILPITIGLLISLNDWFGSDEQKVVRKEFKQKLDAIESELLVHRSKGRSVDQAASLVLTASQEGHLDPKYGLEILSRARDSMTRSIRLEEDILEIREDTESIILMAEKIAPIAKKSRKTFIQAEREVELGSLEEGESLFRLAKKQAKDITDWWDKAEKAISKAKKLLREHKGEAIQSLEKLLSEAENKLEHESPKESFEIADSIPLQISSVEGNAEIANELILVVEQKMQESEGLNLELWNENLERAKNAIKKGDYNLGKGLAESILRELEKERESMDYIRKALNKKSKIKLKWKNIGNHESWELRLKEIEDAADNLEWNHAAILLQRLNESLESNIESFSEANELLEFAKGEWSVLKDKCEKIGIDILDDNRRSAEKNLAESIQALELGELELCLDKLGELDKVMEKMKRRI